MPELPEVETTRRGIAPHIIDRRIERIEVYDSRLRWPVPAVVLAATLPGARIVDVSRRGKYLLLDCGRGHLIVHLGMSGSLRVTDTATPRRRHDHVEWQFDDGQSLRLHDPRRFGCVLWTENSPLAHPLLAELGPEPLDDRFDGAALHRACHDRRCAIKSRIMDSRVVVGVGNIYASEALFRAGIRPGRAAGRVSAKACERLAQAIKTVLGEAIAAGGTTLRDFRRSDGTPGYFRVHLDVYDRPGEPCHRCGSTIRRRVIGQRASYYCPACQC